MFLMHIKSSNVEFVHQRTIISYQKPDGISDIGFNRFRFEIDITHDDFYSSGNFSWLACFTPFDFMLVMFFGTLSGGFTSHIVLMVTGSSSYCSTWCN